MRFLISMLTVLLVLTASPLSADTTITYQGQLQDSSGPYTGTPDMVFRLYDSLTGTNQIGADVELNNVPVTDGLFQAELDFGEVFDGPRWLELEVDGVTLGPRHRIASVPVAVQALSGGEDTLAELSCSVDELAVFDGSAWTCAEPGGSDTLSELNCLADEVALFDGSEWACADVALADTLAALDCTADEVALFDGSQWICAVVKVSDTLAALNCAGDQIARFDGAEWICADDQDTVYSAGSGLTLSGTEFALDTGLTDGRYWMKGGNAGTDPASDFIGTSDEVPFEIHVHEQRALRIEPSADPDRSPRIIAGHASNEIPPGPLDAHVSGATISGGGSSANPNVASNWYATVGGGEGNEASGSRATVSGGFTNTASEFYATVGGGEYNTASGLRATVPGGRRNVADGSFSFAAGNEAEALHDGSFVWSHSDGTPFATTGQDQFLIQAAGGVGIGTNNPQEALDVAGSVRAETVDAQTYLQDGQPFEPGAQTIVQNLAPEPGEPGTVWMRLDEPGTQIWQHTLHSDDDDVWSVFERNGVVYSGSGDGTVIAADASDGSLLWQHTLHTNNVFSVFERNGVVYSASWDGHVIAADGSDGSKLWQHSLHSGGILSVFERNGMVYSGSFDGTVIAADASDGSLQWQQSQLSGWALSVFERNGVVYVGTQYDTVFALDASDGSENWEHSLHTNHVNSVFERNGVVYSGSGDGTVIAADSSDGSKLWQHSLHSGGITSVFERNGVVYSGSGDGTVIAADSSNGNLLWQHSLHSDNVLSVFERNGMVYSGSQDNTVIAATAAPAMHISDGNQWLLQSWLFPLDDD